MIITNPQIPPSERLKEILKDYFLPKGYHYTASLNEFSKNIGNKKEAVSVWCNKRAGLVSATFNWGNLFTDLEKIYKIIQIGIEDYHKKGVTVGTELLNYFPRKNSHPLALFLRKIDQPSEFKLYDSVTLKYDDFSINSAAKQLIETYEKYIEPFLEHYEDLQTLERELNYFPIQHHPFIGYGGRHIVFGLVLCYMFEKEKFNLLSENYRQYILNDKEDLEFTNKMIMFLDSTIAYINSGGVNIK